MNKNFEDTQTFDDILEIVGKNGNFQRRFNIIFNFALVVCISMANINIIIAMSVPEHWCKVPGREFTNYSLEEWKNLTLPRELDARGKDSFSSCNMYHIRDKFQDYLNISAFLELKHNKTGCKYGWEYDDTWYKETVPSTEDWICRDSLKISNTFAVMRVADVSGTFICGQLGDIIGRLPVFVMSLVFLVLGNLMFVFTSTKYIYFLLSGFIAGFTSYTAYQAPLIIGMEISREKDKAYIAMLQNIGRTIGICILPPIMWVIGYWKPFMVLSTVPCLIFFLPYKYIIESPRWLASKEQTTRCLKVLKKLAEVNKVQLPEDSVYTLRKSNVRETTYGAISLFSSWRLAKNTTCLVICWVVTFTAYLTLTLNSSNLDGNPFLNFVYQGIVELPAIILGKYLADRIGRRWTNVGSFSLIFLGCIPLIYIVTGSSPQWLLIVFVVFLKFAVMLAYYVVGLQSVEMYPTCLRQTGVSVGGLSAAALGTVGPYLVHLGVSQDARYPYVIIACMSLFASFCGFMLPETVRGSPGTLEEAKAFGKGQKLFRMVELQQKFEE